MYIDNKLTAGMPLQSACAARCTEPRRQEFKNTRKVARHRRKNGRNVQLKTLKID